ncbi:MAG TPA: cytidine deaminase [Chryseosolibacter sp.]|nr:cytidine deaminase [Chryseosolibacter sp.]
MNSFVIVNHLEDLDLESKYLVHKAKDALNHAYAPYSRFQVGAAVLLEDGSVITGTNQENAAYPSGMCAERVALFTTVSQHPDQPIVKLAVVARRKGTKELIPATACGSCRQVMLEMETRQGKPFEVIMQGQDHKWIKAISAESLLPFGFTAVHLDHGEKKGNHL